MKVILKILLFITLILIAIGYYLKNYTTINGEIYIGFAVLIFAFLLMPLFIYHRYKNRIGDFVDKRMEKELPKSDTTN